MNGCLLLLGLLYSVSAGFGLNVPGVTTSEQFKYSTLLDTDGNYFLFWNFNVTHVTFEIHVRTKGWVGFGMSGNGNMFPGDVVIGWVNNGTTHFATVPQQIYHPTDKHTYVPPTPACL